MKSIRTAKSKPNPLQTMLISTFKMKMIKSIKFMIMYRDENEKVPGGNAFGVADKEMSGGVNVSDEESQNNVDSEEEIDDGVSNVELFVCMCR